jgi:hypothetical protein
MQITCFINIVTWYIGYRLVLDWWPDLLDSSIQCVTTTCKSPLHTVTSSLPLLDSDFQRRTFPFLWVPELPQCHSYQLLTATAHKDWTSAALWLTHQPTQFTPHVPCFQHLGVDRTEHAVPLLLFTGRCLVTAVALLLTSRSLPSNSLHDTVSLQIPKTQRSENSVSRFWHETSRLTETISLLCIHFMHDVLMRYNIFRSFALPKAYICT